MVTRALEIMKNGLPTTDVAPRIDRATIAKAIAETTGIVVRSGKGTEAIGKATEATGIRRGNVAGSVKGAAEIVTIVMIDGKEMIGIEKKPEDPDVPGDALGALAPGEEASVQNTHPARALQLQ